MKSETPSDGRLQRWATCTDEQPKESTKMIRIIDRNGEVVIQKVQKPDGTVLRYQYGIPGDATTFKHARSLTEARIAIGKGNGPVTPATKTLAKA